MDMDVIKVWRAKIKPRPGFVLKVLSLGVMIMNRNARNLSTNQQDTSSKNIFEMPIFDGLNPDGLIIRSERYF